MTGARLLGFTRGQCLTGPERGRVLVRSVWRADAELRPREARFEIADRRVVAPADVEDALSLGSHPFAVIIRRELQEAALTWSATSPCRGSAPAAWACAGAARHRRGAPRADRGGWPGRWQAGVIGRRR